MVTRISVEQWERHAEWPLAALALVFLAAYSLEVLTRPRGYESHVLWAVTWIVWGLFALDYLARLCLATTRRGGSSVTCSSSLSLRSHCYGRSACCVF